MSASISVETLHVTRPSLRRWKGDIDYKIKVSVDINYWSVEVMNGTNRSQKLFRRVPTKGGISLLLTRHFIFGSNRKAIYDRIQHILDNIIVEKTFSVVRQPQRRKSNSTNLILVIRYMAGDSQCWTFRLQRQGQTWYEATCSATFKGASRKLYKFLSSEGIHSDELERNILNFISRLESLIS